MASIPLHCKICPKHPKFSDISHMLTHVGSKGHLSHYFKAQVRSRQESSVREQLHEYDQWYQNHQIEKLISQRMRLKESKGSNCGNGPSTAKDIFKSKCNKKKLSGNREKDRSPIDLIKQEDVIDPRLSDASRLHQPSTHLNKSKASTKRYRDKVHHPKTQDPSSNEQGEQLLPYPKGPQTRQRERISKVRNESEQSSNEEDVTLYGYANDLMYPDLPALPKVLESTVSGYPPFESYQAASDRRQIDTESGSEENSEVSKLGLSKVSEPLKLKGVLWPGMDLFDSASLEEQRKRNQKKNGSISEQMQINSEVVEQTERIYWPSGQLKMERVITGEVQSSSPVREAVEKSRTRAQRSKATRAPLASASTNILRGVGKSQLISGPTRLTRARVAAFRPGPAQSYVNGALLPTGQLRAHLGSYAQADQHPRKGGAGGTELGDGAPTSKFHHAAGLDPFVEKQDIHATRRNHVYQDDSVQCPSPVCQRLAPPDPSYSRPVIPYSSHQRKAQDYLHGMPYLDARYHSQSSDLRWTTMSSSASVQGYSGIDSLDFSRSSMANKENVVPVIDRGSRIERGMSQLAPQYIDQRYSTIEGNQVSSDYGGIPPYMDFTTLDRGGGHAQNQLLNPLAFSFHQAPRHSVVLSQKDRTQGIVPITTIRRDDAAESREDASKQMVESDDDTIDEAIDDDMLFHVGEL